RLLDEHLDVGLLLGERGVHLLDREHAPEAMVAAHEAAPDVGHPATAGLLDQLVPAADDCAGLRFDGHRGIVARVRAFRGGAAGSTLPAMLRALLGVVLTVCACTSATA